MSAPLSGPTTVLLLGPRDGEHLELALHGAARAARRPVHEDWLEALVTGRLWAFRFAVEVGLEALDLSLFLDGLRTVHSTLAGRAELTMLEGQLGVVVDVLPNGGLEVAVRLVDEQGNELRGELSDLDQSHLPAVVEVLATALGR